MAASTYRASSHGRDIARDRVRRRRRRPQKVRFIAPPLGTATAQRRGGMATRVIAPGGARIYARRARIALVARGRGIARCAAVEDESALSASASPEACARRVRDGDATLICGEGDFSFALAFATAASANARIVATSLAAREEVVEAWRGGDNVDALRKRPNCRVEHGVDATTLSTTFAKETFDRVLFNFPHIPGKAKMDRNRELLAAYLREALRVAPNGFVECALAPGQGGTSSDGENRREYGNSWQCYTHGAENGALLVEAVRFEDAAWRARGYESRGHWRGLRAERGFLTEGGVVHVFCAESRARELGLECDHCVPFTRDVSVWASAADDDSALTVRRAFERACGDFDARVSSVERIDEWRDDSGRTSETFRVEYASRTMALTRARVNAWNDAARNALGDRLRGVAPT